MALISTDLYVPQHANRGVRAQTGAGSAYVGTHRKPEPDWYRGFLGGVMEANRFQEAFGSLTNFGRR